MSKVIGFLSELGEFQIHFPLRVLWYSVDGFLGIRAGGCYTDLLRILEAVGEVFECRFAGGRLDEFISPDARLDFMGLAAVAAADGGVVTLEAAVFMVHVRLVPRRRRGEYRLLVLPWEEVVDRARDIFRRLHLSHGLGDRIVLVGEPQLGGFWGHSAVSWCVPRWLTAPMVAVVLWIVV